MKKWNMPKVSSYYNHLKRKHLTEALIAHDKWERGGDWEEVRAARWRANCVDFLDPEFFQSEEKKHEQEREALREKIQQELEYQQRLTKNDFDGAEIWAKICIESSNEKIKKYERKLQKYIVISDDPNIERAKDYPIDELMEFRRGFALCPFHNEKTASFKYYKETNTGHCFGCGKSADAIDVAMAVWQVDFPTALGKLST